MCKKKTTERIVGESGLGGTRLVCVIETFSLASLVSLGFANKFGRFCLIILVIWLKQEKLEHDRLSLLPDLKVRALFL